MVRQNNLLMSGKQFNWTCRHHRILYGSLKIKFKHKLQSRKKRFCNFKSIGFTWKRSKDSGQRIPAARFKTN